MEGITGAGSSELCHCTQLQLYSLVHFGVLPPRVGGVLRSFTPWFPRVAYPRWVGEVLGFTLWFILMFYPHGWKGDPSSWGESHNQHSRQQCPVLTLPAGPAEGQCGVHLVLDLDQGIEHHGPTPAAEIPKSDPAEPPESGFDPCTHSQQHLRGFSSTATNCVSIPGTKQGSLDEQGSPGAAWGSHSLVLITEGSASSKPVTCAVPFLLSGARL